MGSFWSLLVPRMQFSNLPCVWSVFLIVVVLISKAAELLFTSVFNEEAVGASLSDTWPTCSITNSFHWGTAEAFTSNMSCYLFAALAISRSGRTYTSCFLTDSWWGSVMYLFSCCGGAAASDRQECSWYLAVILAGVWRAGNFTAPNRPTLARVCTRYSVPAFSWSSLTRSPQVFMPQGRMQRGTIAAGGGGGSQRLLRKLDPRSLGDETGDIWACWELSSVIARHLWKVVETRGDHWLGKGQRYTHQQKEQGGCCEGTTGQSVALWSLKKTMGQILLDAFLGHMKEKVIGNNQRRFTKGESCLTNLSAS